VICAIDVSKVVHCGKKRLVKEVLVKDKLWVDDLRDPPDDTWVWSKTSADAMSTLTLSAKFRVMSLDHDLGGDDTARYKNED
jgi:hypothetical protein